MATPALGLDLNHTCIVNTFLILEVSKSKQMVLLLTHSFINRWIGLTLYLEIISVIERSPHFLGVSLTVPHMLSTTGECRGLPMLDFCFLLSGITFIPGTVIIITHL